MKRRDVCRGGDLAVDEGNVLLSAIETSRNIALVIVTQRIVCFAWLQYLLYLPFVIKAIHTNCYGGHETDNWSLHMLIVSMLRIFHGQIWMSVSRWQALFGRTEIQKKGTKFDQVDREENW